MFETAMLFLSYMLTGAALMMTAGTVVYCIVSRLFNSRRG